MTLAGKIFNTLKTLPIKNLKYSPLNIFSVLYVFCSRCLVFFH